MLLEEKLLETKISALLCIEKSNTISYLLAGVGGRIEVYEYYHDNSKNECAFKLSELRVFSGSNIHGFVLSQDESKLLVYGAKSVRILHILNNWQSISTSTLEDTILCNDWIIDAHWLNDIELMILTAHNRVEKLSLKSRNVNKCWKCEEKCILYSGCLVPSRTVNSVPWYVLSGTVFQEIVIWHLNENQKDITVDHRLKGHEGVIFSIVYCPKRFLICSTSDDRTARVWKINFNFEYPHQISKSTIEESLILRNCASSRVFRSLFLDEYIITVTEDSILEVWSQEGKSLFKTKAHDGCAIWSVKGICYDGIETIFTGGGDGSIRHWNLNNCIDFSPKAVNHSSLQIVDCPKLVCFYQDFLIVLSNCGKIIWIKDNEHGLLASDEKLKSCAIMKLDQEKLICATICGKLLIYKLKISHPNLLTVNNFSELDLFCGKVFSLNVLKPGVYLACGQNGCLKFLSNQSLLIEFSLPKTGDQHFLSSATMDEKSKLLMVGDRNGYVFIYCLVTQKLVHRLKRVHERHGVGDMKISNGYLFTIGRESFMKTFRLLPIISEISCIKLPMQWLDKFWKFKGIDIIIGFLSTNVVFYDILKDRILLEFSCGGGHRSWDIGNLNIHKKILQFAYIKDRKLYRCPIHETFLTTQEIRPSFHSRHINAVHHFAFGLRNYLVTAGENVSLNCHQITESNGYLVRQTITTIKSHISSVKCIRILDINKESKLMITAGGRAQIKAWEITFKDDVIFSEKSSYLLKGSDKYRKKTWRVSNLIYDTEIRYMDVEVFLSVELNLFYVITGCSDGVLRLFSLKSEKFELIFESNPLSHCILRLMKCSSENLSFITATTDGFLRFCHIIDNRIVFQNQQNVHGSGINSLISDSISYRIFSGDDAGDIGITNLRKINDFKLIERCHAAQITGLNFIKPHYLISTSIDQRITIWKYENGDLEQINQVCADISDIQAVAVWKSFHDKYYLAIAGEGMAIFSIRM